MGTLFGCVRRGLGFYLQPFFFSSSSVISHCLNKSMNQVTLQYFVVFSTKPVLFVSIKSVNLVSLSREYSSSLIHWTFVVIVIKKKEWTFFHHPHSLKKNLQRRNTRLPFYGFNELFTVWLHQVHVLRVHFTELHLYNTNKWNTYGLWGFKVVESRSLKKNLNNL